MKPDFPDDEHLKKIERQIRNKYTGKQYIETLRLEFAQRFLVYEKDSQTLFFDKQGQETESFVLPDSATNSLVVPWIIKAFIIGAYKDKARKIDRSIRFLWPERKVFCFSCRY